MAPSSPAAASASRTLRSLSYVGPALGPGALAALLADAHALAREHGGAVWARALGLHWTGPR